MKNASPQSGLPSSWPLCFITFRVTNPERFHILAHAFEILKQEKCKYLEAVFEDVEQDEQENDGYEVFRNLHEQVLRNLMDIFFDAFDEHILAHFWWPSKQENQDYWQRWAATPAQQRSTDPTLDTAWDFESMLDCFLNGEYEFISCTLLTPDTGVFEFSPFSFPYGGTGCMKAFIEAFDFPILGEDNGTGYISYL